MTNTRNSQKITITRHGARIRHGWFDLDGSLALIIILIIVAARISWHILVIAGKVTAWLGRCGAAVVRYLYPRIARRITGLYRYVRAFYMP